MLFDRLRMMRRPSFDLRATNWIQPGRRDSEDLSMTNVLDHLVIFDDLECKDPRDRIAALRGLGIASMYTSSLKIDYEQSVEENYVRFAIDMVEAGILVQILQAAASRQPYRSRHTWVPDWRIRASSDSTSPSLWRFRGREEGVRVRFIPLGAELSINATCRMFSVCDWPEPWINHYVFPGLKVDILVPTKGTPDLVRHVCTFDEGRTFFAFVKTSTDPGKRAISLAGELQVQMADVIHDSHVDPIPPGQPDTSIVPRLGVITLNELETQLQREYVLDRMKTVEVFIV